MKRLMKTGWIVAFCLFIPWIAWAGDVPDERPVSERQAGVSAYAGAQFPLHSRYEITESWGFFVDIPIISTFYVTPQANLYRLVRDQKPTATQSAYEITGITDLSMNFKFVVPVDYWRVYFAATLGMSNGKFKPDNVILPHFGGLFGFGYRAFPNIDLFLQSQYKILVSTGEGNPQFINLVGGVSFWF